MRALWILSLLLAPAVGAAAEASLGQAIPEDYYFYLRRRANPERASLQSRLGAALKAVDEAKIADAILDTVLHDLPEARRAAARQEASHWRRVLSGVAWSRLLGKEFAVGARFDMGWQSGSSLDANPSFDWVALFRVDPAETRRHLAALRQVVLALSTLEEEVDPETGRKASLEVIDTDRDGVPLVLLAAVDGEAKLCLGGQGDVIAAASSAIQLRRALKLLAGEGSGRGVAEGEEFGRLMGGLPPPEDGELFIRPGVVFRQLSTAGRLLEKARVPPELSSDVERAVRALDGIIETLDLVGGVAATETTQGRRLVESYRIEMVPEAKKRPLYGALVDRPGLGDFTRLVPRQASGFTLASGVDLERLHETVAGFIQRVLPGGADLLEEYQRFQEKSGFDVKRDLLSLIEGRTVLLGFPPEEPATAEGGGSEKRKYSFGDWVLLARLKDAQRAEAKLGEWLGKAADGLKAIGMGPERVELADVPGSFRRIALPIPAGLGITFGVSGDELAVGTSPERIRQAFLVRTGKVESIQSSAEWSRLDLRPQGQVQAVVYQDVRDLGGKGLATLSVLGSLLPDRPDGTSPRLKLFLPLVMTLGPVLGEALKPFDKVGGYLVRDGDGLRGEAVILVRPEGPEPAPAAPADPEKPVEKKKRTF